ncbi:MAG: PIN domain-containing protein [Fimbriimonadaceae bacterium]|nr:PIN domain-containing protein [Fimbriimonadaceae bacterium]
MKLADTNVWLALVLSEHEFHSAARRWFAERSAQEVVFCRATQQSFLRLLTTRAVMSLFGVPPLRNQHAWGVYDRLRADSRVGWLAEAPGLERLWRSWSASPAASPKRWMDAYLGALAASTGCRLVTNDRAFDGFDGLDVEYLEA